MISRRAFLATSAGTAIAGAFGRQVLVDARQVPQAAPPTPVFTPIRRNIGYFTMRGGTIGYLIDPRGIVVVDTQFAPEGKICLDGLNERSGSRPVDRLINTHHHPDHIGGNISFKAVAKSVVAQARAAEHMRQPPGGVAPTTEQLYPTRRSPIHGANKSGMSGCARSSTDRRTRAGTWWSRSSAPTSRTRAT